MSRDFLEFFGVIWCLQSQEELVLGAMVTSTGPENHENGGFSGFPKWNRQVPDPK